MSLLPYLLYIHWFRFAASYPTKNELHLNVLNLSHFLDFSANSDHLFSKYPFLDILFLSFLIFLAFIVILHVLVVSPQCMPN